MQSPNSEDNQKARASMGDARTKEIADTLGLGYEEVDRLMKARKKKK